MKVKNVNLMAVLSVVLLGLVVVSGLVVVPGSVAAQPTNNSTVNNSTQYVGSLNADLYIDQPHYISSRVTTQKKSGRIIYQASGEVLELAPRNFSAENVVEYGVSGSVGKLSYNKAIGRYVFNPQGKDGTYEVWFVVSEEVKTGNNSTKMVERTYTAIISVDKTSMSHYESGKLEEMRNDADKWQQWATSVKSIGFESVEKATELAYSALVFIKEPASYLTGGYLGTWILIATQPGGILVLLTILIAFLSLSWFYIKYGNMRAARDAAQKTLSEKKREIEYENLLNQMATTPPHAIFPNENDAEIVADALGNSDNLRDMWEVFKQVFSPGETLRERLKVMHAVGYVAVDTDNGLEVHREDTVRSGADTKRLVDLSENEVAEVDYDDRVRRFDMSGADVNVSDGLEIDVDEVNERLGVTNASTEDKKRWVSYMVDVANAVQQHNLTDNEGRENGFARVFDSLLRLAVGAEKMDAPMSRYYKEHFEYLLQQYSVENEGSKIVEQSKSAGDIR